MYHVSLHCLVLKLMGENDVSPVFASLQATMNISNEDELLRQSIEIGQDALIQFIYLCRLILAYWFQNYEDAALNAELYGNDHMRFIDIYHVFYEGLTALRMAQKGIDTEKWIAKGEAAVATFKTWEGHCKWNFENKHILLSAELLFVKGEHEEAQKQYEAAIDSAKKHKFLHEEGLAMELLGLFHKEVGNTEDAKTMFNNARDCYEQWGATAVIERIDSQL